MCDLTLPDIDGFTFVTALHEDPRTGALPVLAFTGVDLSETDKARLGGKIVGVVAKGDLDPADLRTWLARAIRPLVPSRGAEAAAGAGTDAATDSADSRETVLT
jgi:CheY-like chemotaxis protein